MVISRSPSPAASLPNGEAALLESALGHLRRDHDAARALVDLDRRDREFSRGSFAREAALARAEALLALGRGPEALSVLDALHLEARVTDRHASLARAELRAQRGLDDEAVLDFDRVLASGGDDELAARALYGRAVCRLRVGGRAGAREDLRAYIQRFPEGLERAQVGALLGRLGE